MSEEILRALMQLFAIIAKQDEGVTEQKRNYVRSFLLEQLGEKVVNEFMTFFEEQTAEKKPRAEKNPKIEALKKRESLTAMKDSVKTLGLCKKINKTLTQSQKIVVLVRLFELINADRQFTSNRLEIIITASSVFNISKDEYNAIKSFVIAEDLATLDSPDIMIINSEHVSFENCKHATSEGLDGNIIILHVKSVDLYFLSYRGKSEVFLNGSALKGQRIYLFANGSTVRFAKAKPIYYSDVVAHYMADSAEFQMSFVCEDLYFKFPNGNIGLRGINIYENTGKLIGLMGASGAGKTTLLNVLSGIETPSDGEVRINGYNIHQEPEMIEGVIGYIPQDDLLIEELTVYQNLYYNAKLCFKNLSEEELQTKVMSVLKSLGLDKRAHLKVGNPLDKKISGGQRKRLNIALELIREPSVLFVDEPTSGLSSRDSENVMDLLRELALKGKLIFVVIHQPSSDIYKMFDKIMFLDEGGYPIYYGNPVESVIYFKKMDNQLRSDEGECPTCGNVNPELIFNIIEAQVVDEYGQLVGQRKVLPEEWGERYNINFTQEKINEIAEAPPKALNIPSKIKQFLVFGTRDILSKLGNTQYLLINLLEAPLLAFTLAFIIRYVSDPKSGVYLFSLNDNIPAYIFMSIIVALFMGLTVSAEEIFRDRKILKREAFLNLSKGSYLFSKMGILFFISAIQTFSFVVVGNLILGLNGMYVEYWLVLFTVSCFANMLGLNISASFNSAVTIYILIPILLIPQMILSGAIFSFDKINQYIGSRDKVPFIADMMASRWAFEALAVNQFKNNEYNRFFYDFEKEESVADYKQVHYIPALVKINKAIYNSYSALQDLTSDKEADSIKKTIQEDITLLNNEVAKEQAYAHEIKYASGIISIENYNETVYQQVENYLERLTEFYTNKFNQANVSKDQFISKLQSTPEKEAIFRHTKEQYHNESLAELVRNLATKERIIRVGNKLVQQIDPVYLDPNPQLAGFFNFRTQFFAPKKQFAGELFDTYAFNIIFIWLMSLVLFFTLYFDALKKILSLPEKLMSKKKKKKNLSISDISKEVLPVIEEDIIA